MEASMSEPVSEPTALELADVVCAAIGDGNDEATFALGMLCGRLIRAHAELASARRDAQMRCDVSLGCMRDALDQRDAATTRAENAERGMKENGDLMVAHFNDLQDANARAREVHALATDQLRMHRGNGDGIAVTGRIERILACTHDAKGGE
jgi:hypothetical protein